MLMRPRDSLLRSLRRSTSDGSRYEKRVDAKGRESEPVCIDGEIPFQIPRGWEWARLGTFASFGGGGTPDKNNPSFWNGDIPWASMKDIHGSRLEGTIDSITEAGLKVSVHFHMSAWANNSIHEVDTRKDDSVWH